MRINYCGLTSVSPNRARVFLSPFFIHTLVDHALIQKTAALSFKFIVVAHVLLTYSHFIRRFPAWPRMCWQIMVGHIKGPP